MESSKSVTLRNATDHHRVFNDVVCGEVGFGPGEVKTINVSSAEAEALKTGRAGWESTTKAEAAKVAKAEDAEAAKVAEAEAAEAAKVAEAEAAETAKAEEAAQAKSELPRKTSKR
jgi:hypothetical protein